MKTKYPYEELKKAIVDETLYSLANKPIKSTTYERVILLHEADELYAELAQPKKYGKAYYHLLKNCSVPVKDTDLLLGRIAEKVLDESEERIFQSLAANNARPLWVTDTGHRSFWWEGLIEHGIVGLRARAVTELEKRRNDGVTGSDRIDFLEGIITLYDAFILYLERYAASAESAGLDECAEVCRALTLHAPNTFREALQLLLTVQLVYCCFAAANPTLSLGRADMMLEHLYERDKAEGRITADEARLLILDYYSKHNLVLGRGEHQMSAVCPESVTGWERNLNYDAPQYLLLAGRRRDGSYLDGELTHLFVEMIEPRFKNPVVDIRYAPDMQKKCPALWRKIAERVKASASMMIYNEQDCISAYKEAGADECDAFDFQHYGCNHSIIPGTEALCEYGGATPLWILVDILNEWVSEGYEPSSTEEIYSAVSEKVRAYTCKTVDRLAESYEKRMSEPVHHLEMTDCFYVYPVPSASSFKNYGSKYICSSVHICSFASFVDALCAVDELVIKQKKVTLSALMKATRANFEGYPEMLALCRKMPKLGDGDDIPRAHARAMMNKFIDDVHEYAEKRLAIDVTRPIYKDLPVIPRPIVKISMESDNEHLTGQKMGATPDGRLAGAPISQNSAPSIGACRGGFTARLSSMASIPFDRIVSGAQNLSIQPRTFEGESGTDILASLLGTYFDMGGLQLQVTSIDPSMLTDAQKNPDLHRDLMVRVTGYSAIFVDMEKHAQDDIIRREVM
jgi:formate C-acetyltransferase